MTGAWRQIVMRAVALLALSLVAFPAHSESPPERLRKIRAEIEEREARARKASRDAEGLLASVDALERENLESRRSRRILKEQQDEAKGALAQEQISLGEAQRELRAVRESLNARLRVLYKARYAGNLPALYSSRDFQSSLRLASSLSRVIESDAVLFTRYRKREEEVRTRKKTARELANVVEETEVESLKRKQLEAKRTIDKRNQIDLLRARADRDQRVANELRAVAEKLAEQMRLSAEAVPATTGSGLKRGKVPWPVDGKVRLGFGKQVDPEFNTVTRRTGIEIEAPTGDVVRAVGAGRVIFADWFRGYGQVVIVDHGSGTVSVSGFLEDLYVKANDNVQDGQSVGIVGETGSFSGPGLYFELRENGQPVDPEVWLQGKRRG